MITPFILFQMILFSLLFLLIVTKSYNKSYTNITLLITTIIASLFYKNGYENICISIIAVGFILTTIRTMLHKTKDRIVK